MAGPGPREGSRPWPLVYHLKILMESVSWPVEGLGLSELVSSHHPTTTGKLAAKLGYTLKASKS
jgi:hypothetical protein